MSRIATGPQQQWEYRHLRAVSLQTSDGQTVLQRNDPRFFEALTETIESLDRHGQAGWKLASVSIEESTEGECRLGVCMKRLHTLRDEPADQPDSSIPLHRPISRAA